MIRSTQTCDRGHSYSVIRPEKYTGKAVYPQQCPQCRHTKT